MQGKKWSIVILGILVLSGVLVSLSQADNLNQQMQVVGRFGNGETRELALIVETKLLDHTTDEHTPENVFALVPLEILETYTTYTAHFEAEVNAEAYSKEWEFSTGPFMEVNPGKVGCVVGQVVEVSINGGTGGVEAEWISDDGSVIAIELKQGVSGVTMLVTGKKIGEADITVTDSGKQEVIPVSVVEEDDTIELQTGWNMAALSRTANQTNATLVLSEIKDQLISAWKCDLSEGSGTWAVYLSQEADVGAAYAEAKGFTLLTDLQAREGFWLNMKSSETLHLSGSTPQEQITLLQGWNLAGSRGFEETNCADLFTPIKDTLLSAWKWELSGGSGTWAVYLPQESDGGEAYAQSKGFESLTAIKPGEGFWINAEQGSILP